MLVQRNHPNLYDIQDRATAAITIRKSLIPGACIVNEFLSELIIDLIAGTMPNEVPFSDLDMKKPELLVIHLVG